MPQNRPYPKIQQNATFQVKRALSAPGRILVSQGQSVSATTLVAESPNPAHFAVVNLAQALDLPDVEPQAVLLKQAGDKVEAGEVIAEHQGRLPFFKKTCKATVNGTIIALVDEYVLIETETPHQQVPALVDGRVVEVDYGHSVTIEVTGTHIQAACGLGGESYGPLKLFSEDPQASIQGEAFAVLDRHVIYLAGGSITAEAIRHAEAIGLGGIIVGSIDAALLKMTPPPAIPVIATEGFGSRPMSVETFNILKTCAGRPVSLQAGRPGTANAGRTSIILPSPEVVSS